MFENEAKRTRLDEETASIPVESEDYEVAFANPSQDEKALPSKLQRYYKLKRMSRSSVRQDLRYMAYLST